MNDRIPAVDDLDPEDRRFLAELNTLIAKEEVVQWRLDHLPPRLQWRARQLERIKWIPLVVGAAVGVAGVVGGLWGLGGSLWLVAWTVGGLLTAGSLRSALLDGLYEAVPVALRDHDQVVREMDEHVDEAIATSACWLWLLERIQHDLSAPAAELDGVLLQGAREVGEHVELEAAMKAVSAEATERVFAWAESVLEDDALATALAEQAGHDDEGADEDDPIRIMQAAQSDASAIARATREVTEIASTFRRMASDHRTGDATRTAFGPVSLALRSIVEVASSDDDVDSVVDEEPPAFAAQGGTGSVAVPVSLTAAADQASDGVASA